MSSSISNVTHAQLPSGLCLSAPVHLQLLHLTQGQLPSHFLSQTALETALDNLLLTHPPLNCPANTSSSPAESVPNLSTSHRRRPAAAVTASAQPPALLVWVTRSLGAGSRVRGSCAWESRACGSRVRGSHVWGSRAWGSHVWGFTSTQKQGSK